MIVVLSYLWESCVFQTTTHATAQETRFCLCGVWGLVKAERCQTVELQSRGLFNGGRCSLGNGAKASEPVWLLSKLSISTKPGTLSIGFSFLLSPRSAAAAWIAWASPFAGFEDLVP